MSPSSILVIYENTDGTTYIEVADIEGKQIVNSRPLSLKNIQEMIRFSEKKPKSSVYMPINRHIMMYRESPITVAWIYPKTSFTIIVGNKTLLIQGIQLLLIVNGGDLYSYFIKRSNGMNTILYDVELPNVTRGHVCTGKFRIRTENLSSIITDGEIAFFETAFYEQDKTTVAEAKEMKPVNRKRLKRIGVLKNYDRIR